MSDGSTIRWASILTAVGALSGRMCPGPTFVEGKREGNCYTYAMNETGPARNPDIARLRPIQDPDDCDGYPIALALSDHDYHWWRRDAGGWWSHKPGFTDPTETDYVGNLIVSPETTNRGAYTHFVGYFCVRSF